MTVASAARSKAATRATYDRLSPWYDGLAGSRERRLTAEALAMLAVRGGEAILEIGCGTGHALAALSAAVGPGGRVTGLDLSTAMLRQAGRRASTLATAENIRLVGGDGAHLPFAAGAFDTVFMSFTLELFDAPELYDVLRECRRVLVASGRLGIVALSASDPVTVPVRLYEWAHEHFPHLVDCRPIPVCQLVTSAGYRVDTEVSRRLWGLPVTIVMATSGAVPGV